MGGEVIVKKSVHINIMLNIMRTLLSVAFPLVSYPYATRILHVENFGKVSFSQSIISYVGLIAALGISSYAIREGGDYREDNNRLSKFASEVFSINLISTLISYFLLLILIVISAEMRNNVYLLLIISITIIMTTLSVEWINIIFEDYLFITIRSFIIQCISLVLLFGFIKQPSDYYKYALIQVLNTGLIAFSNFFYTRKFCTVLITKNLNLKKHLKPILILFSNSLAVSIYLNVDNVLIGFIIGENFVGLYSVSVKVYTILKLAVASVYNVTITRMSEYISNNKISEYKKLLNDILNNLIFISVPITAGIICTSKEIIFILAGEEYLLAATSLRILSVAILFAVIGGTLANCINLPHKREKKNLIGTTISAVINLLLNIVVIPCWGISGAAFTTLIAEISICIFLIISMKDLWYLFNIKEISYNTLKSTIAVVPFFMFQYFLKNVLGLQGMKYLAVIIVLSVFSYCVLGIIIKNKCLLYYKKFLKTKN